MNKEELIPSERCIKEREEFRKEKEKREIEYRIKWNTLSIFEKITYGSFSNYFFEFDTSPRVKKILRNLGRLP